MEILLNENLFAQWIGGSTGPQTGLMWFTAELQGIEKSHTGKLLTFDTWADDKDFPVEEPEHIYVEIDPAEGMARAQLQTIVHERPMSFHADLPRQLVEPLPDLPPESTILFYTATTDVSDADRMRDAVQLAIEATVEKWTRAPYGSGDARVIPRELRLRPTEEYVEEIFQPSPGFYGVTP